MKTTYSISGFKGLKNSMPLEIKPLTILIGPNSAGKSSIIQSMMMLKQSINNKNEELLTLNGDNVQLGSYKNIITDNKVSNNPLVIDLLFEDINKNYFINKRRSRCIVNSLHISLEIKKYPKQLRVKKYYLTIIINQNDIRKLSINYSNNSYVLTYNNKDIELESYDSDSLFPFFYFMARNNPLIEEASNLINISQKIVKNYFNKSSHISAYRQQPHRYYYNTSNSYDGIGTNGQNLASSLYNISKDKYHEKMEQINKWMKKLELTNKIYLELCIDSNLEIYKEYKKHIDDYNDLTKTIIKTLFNSKSYKCKYINKHLSSKQLKTLDKVKFDPADIKFLNVAYGSDSKLLVSHDSDFGTISNDKLPPSYQVDIRKCFSDLGLNVVTSKEAVKCIDKAS